MSLYKLSLNIVFSNRKMFETVLEHNISADNNRISLYSFGAAVTSAVKLLQPLLSVEVNRIWSRKALKIVDSADKA